MVSAGFCWFLLVPAGSYWFLLVSAGVTVSPPLTLISKHVEMNWKSFVAAGLLKPWWKSCLLLFACLCLNVTFFMHICMCVSFLRATLVWLEDCLCWRCDPEIHPVSSVFLFHHLHPQSAQLQLQEAAPCWCGDLVQQLVSEVLQTDNKLFHFLCAHVFIIIHFLCVSRLTDQSLNPWLDQRANLWPE